MSVNLHTEGQISWRCSRCSFMMENMIIKFCCSNALMQLISIFTQIGILLIYFVNKHFVLNDKNPSALRLSDISYLPCLSSNGKQKSHLQKPKSGETSLQMQSGMGWRYIYPSPELLFTGWDPVFLQHFSISSVLTRITALVPFDHLLNKVVCPWRTAQAEVRLDSWLPAPCDWNEVQSDVTFDLTKLIVQRQACFLLWHQAPALLCLKKNQ